MLLALVSKMIRLQLLNRWGSDVLLKSFRQTGLDFSKSIYLDRKCPNIFYLIKTKICILDEIMNHSDNEQLIN